MLIIPVCVPKETDRGITLRNLVARNLYEGSSLTSGNE